MIHQSYSGRPSRARPGRRALRIVFLVAVLTAGACGRDRPWHTTDVSGNLPPLAFTLTRAEDARTVTAADFRGDMALLYFGYTLCPDACPTTLAALDRIVDDLGPRGHGVRILFVTVDPNRDTLPVLKTYVASFGTEVIGLRGTPDQLAALARRYRVAYSVRPGDARHPYRVTHSSAVYVFDREGDARLLITSLAAASPDIDGVAADLRRLTGAGVS